MPKSYLKAAMSKATICHMCDGVITKPRDVATVVPMPT